MVIGLKTATLYNATAIGLSEVPLLDSFEFRHEVAAQIQQGGRLSALFVMPQGLDHARMFAVIGNPQQSALTVCSTMVGSRYESLTTSVPQAHWFEREIAEQWGIVPEGHPWLKPIRFHASYHPGQDAWQRDSGAEILPGVAPYFRVAGEECHEVAVGPVHAGVIEPGHFRFQCHGEIVLNLEIELGYQHRGIERALIGGPNKRTLHYMETLAGDTTIGHATAYCEALESLAGTSVPMRAQAIRGIALELERLACHTGDLGALADDVGYLPTANYCGRLRGDFLNSTASLCGNRFGRSLVRPGGVGFDLDQARIEQMSDKLAKALTDVDGAVRLLWNSPSVQSRFEDCGTLSLELSRQLGLVGPAARACGDEVDVRHDFPSGIYRYHQVAVSTVGAGDVFARAFVRWLEIQRSVAFIQQQLDFLKKLKTTTLLAPVGKMRGDSLIVSLVEGWRGEICHVGITNSAGQFAHYKVCDPSFHNWSGLAMALRNQQISDFPLNNKSFNLSYCGHDL
ncbi:MAG: dehydrogenase (ubiquinone) 30 kDa subunit [Planctomycetaceae bacterium]|nr:dehydrogenase (ubiquinone) 30 kDa subunit [Planctomycetaceae bacterium]